MVFINTMRTNEVVLFYHNSSSHKRMRESCQMVKYKSKPLFKLILTLCFIFSCLCWAGEQEPQYDNLSFGVPGKADTIIDRPGYALGYIEYHEQPAWVIYIMTKA